MKDSLKASFQVVVERASGMKGSYLERDAEIGLKSGQRRWFLNIDL